MGTNGLSLKLDEIQGVTCKKQTSHPRSLAIPLYRNFIIYPSIKYCHFDCLRNLVGQVLFLLGMKRLYLCFQGIEIVNDEQGNVWVTRGSKNHIFVKVGRNALLRSPYCGVVLYRNSHINGCRESELTV